MLLWCIDYFELQVLEKQQMQGEVSLNFPSLPKNRSSKRNSIVINPQDFHQPGKIDSSQERKLEVNTTPRHILSQTITPHSLLRTHSSFLKIIYPPLALFFLFFVFWLRQHVGSQLPSQGSNLHPLHWKHRILTTGPRGKSPFAC